MGIKCAIERIIEIDIVIAISIAYRFEYERILGLDFNMFRYFGLCALFEAAIGYQFH